MLPLVRKIATNETAQKFEKFSDRCRSGVGIIQLIALAGIYVLGCIIISKGPNPCPPAMAWSAVGIAGASVAVGMMGFLMHPKKGGPPLAVALYNVPALVLAILATKGIVFSKALGWTIVGPPLVPLIFACCAMTICRS